LYVCNDNVIVEHRKSGTVVGEIPIFYKQLPWFPVNVNEFHIYKRMKVFRISLKNVAIIVTIFALTAAVISCERDNPSPSPDDDSSPVVVELQNASVRGTALDVDGFPIEGVTVTSGSLSALTAADGTFSFTQVGVVGNRSVVRFEKSGYFPIVRSGAKKDEITIDVVLRHKGDSYASLLDGFNASQAATLEVAGMKVAIPAGALVKADGSAYSGEVTAEMLYLDPNNRDFEEMMPGGDLAAVRSDNSEALLISYGMADVRFTGSNGNPLQLAQNTESEITFPIPAGMDNNLPATIPLWYFNEETGLWVEEGAATRQGNTYVGKVKHFSWWNLDYPNDVIDIKGKVTDCNGQPLKVRVSLLDESNGYSTYEYSSSNGEYHFRAPSGVSLTLTVKSEHYNGYSPEVAHNISSQAGGATVTQNISLPCMEHISVFLVNTCGTIAEAKIWLEYTDDNGDVKQTDIEVVASADGKIRYRIPPVRGLATLYAESLSGERVSKTLTLDGTEQSVTLELCMELDGLVVTASNKWGKGFNMIIPNEMFRISIGASPYILPFPRHDAKIFIGSPNPNPDCIVNLRWNNYTEGTTMYVSESESATATAGILIEEEGGVYISAYGVRFEILSREGFTFRISVKADGNYRILDGDASDQFPVHFEGVINAQLETYNYSWLNVASHENFITLAKEEMKYWEDDNNDGGTEIVIGYTSAISGDSKSVFDVEEVPALPTPYDEVLSSSGLRASEFFNLCWKNATKETFDDVIRRFKTAGFTVGDVYEISYPYLGTSRTSGTKGNILFEIIFDSQGCRLLPRYGDKYGRLLDDENDGFKILLELKGQ
jgi:hypothetical protein